MAKVNKLESDFLEAARSGDLETLHQMLKKDGDLIIARDAEGRTALHWAAYHNYYRMAQILLAHQAEMHAEDRGGKIPLQLAEEQGHREVAQLLRDAEWPKLD